MARMFRHRIVIAVLTVLEIWLLFWWPDVTFSTLVISTPILLVASLSVWFAYRRSDFPYLTVTPTQRMAVWIMIVLMIFAAPASLYWWVLGLPQNVVNHLGIEVERVEQEVRLIDYLLTPSPRRRIVTRYQIAEPLDSAEQKLKIWNDDLSRPWHIFIDSGLTTKGGISIISDVTCNPYDPIDAGGLHYIGIAEDSTLTLIIRFADAPHWCGLPSNIINRLYFPGDDVPER